MNVYFQFEQAKSELIWQKERTQEELAEIEAEIRGIESAIDAKNGNMFEMEDESQAMIGVASLAANKKKPPVNKKALTDELLDTSDTTNELHREIMSELDCWFSGTQDKWIDIANVIHNTPSFTVSEYSLRNVLKFIEHKRNVNHVYLEISIFN